MTRVFAFFTMLCLAFALVASPVMANEKLGLTTGFTEQHEGTWYDVNRTGVYVNVTVSPRAFGNRVVMFMILDRAPGSSTALGATADFVSAPGGTLIDEVLRTNANRMGFNATPYAANVIGSVRTLAKCVKGQPVIDMAVKVSGVTQTYQFVPFMGVDPFLCR